MEVGSTVTGDAIAANRPLGLLIVAGEASGDLHGASLVRQLRGLEPDLRVSGVGGEQMRAAGVELLYDQRHLAVVGITEVLSHLRDLRQAMAVLVDAALQPQVDGIVLIDYPDFNLVLARRVRRRRPDLPIIYYISPQVWAWRRGRLRTIARLVDRMVVILPFEEELYVAAGVDVRSVGHPLLDVVREAGDRGAFAVAHQLPQDAEWVGLLPGSRRAEVRRLLPRMLEAVALLQRERQRLFLVPTVPSVDPEVYRVALARASEAVRATVRLIAGSYYPLLRHSSAVVVCSGTATLETALSDTPMVVVYRTSWLTYNLAKLLVRIRHIALVNVVVGRRVVPELVQGGVTGQAIARELSVLLEDPAARARVQQAFAELRRRLGKPGASVRAAHAVLEVFGRMPRKCLHLPIRGPTTE